jgi:hypothetical protein
MTVGRLLAQDGVAQITPGIRMVNRQFQNVRPGENPT